jgi:hypothetical protein
MGLTLGLLASIAVFLQWLNFLGNFLSYAAQVIILMLWIPWAIVLLYWLNRYLSSFRCQLVHFTKTHFTIEKQNLGIKYFQYQGKIQAIQAVQQSVQIRQVRSLLLQMGKAEMDIVTLQIAQQTYNLGLDLTAAECAWLVQEINDWLKSLHK